MLRWLMCLAMHLAFAAPELSGYIDLTQAEVHADDSAGVRVAVFDLLLPELQRKGLRGEWQVVHNRSMEACGLRSSTCIEILISNVHSVPLLREGATKNASAGTVGLLGVSDEAFVIHADPSRRTVQLLARSGRGMMMAMGRLIREVRVTEGVVVVPAVLTLAVDPAPWARMRGQQVTDWGFYMSEDAFEQHVRDLIVFGTNQIEIAHIMYDAVDDNGVPRDDANALVRMSTVIAKYGLDVSLWNIPWPSNITEAVFAAMPRVDSIFHEGGSLSTFKDTVTALRKHHPNALSWHDPGGQTNAGMQKWYAELGQANVSSWLDGVVYGPIMLGGQLALLDNVPQGYVIRLYPDICHTLTAMYPVPDWHYAWAFTQGRQVVNPLPLHYSAAVRTLTNATFNQRMIGFGAYSEGAADDFNECLWSALYLEPVLTAADVTQQYARHFFGSDVNITALGVDLLFGQEQSWVGDAATNPSVVAAFATAQQLEAAILTTKAPTNTIRSTHSADNNENNDSNHRHGHSNDSDNWRLQAHVFRSYFDMYVQTRLRFEQTREANCYRAIAAAAVSASRSDIDQAQATLTVAFNDTMALALKDRLFHIAHSINDSTTLCGGCQAGGMLVLQSQIPTLSLDTIDTPLADHVFLAATLFNVSLIEDESQRRAQLLELLHYHDPAPGGFYDHLGASPRSVRLEIGDGPQRDPQFVFAPLVQFDEDETQWPPCGDCGAGNGPPQRLAWHSWAQTYGDMPLTLHYPGLDSTALYTVRIVYGYQGWSGYPLSSLTAISKDGTPHLLQDFMPAPKPNRPLEFQIPLKATQAGQVTIECRQPAGSAQNGNGRGCLISEIWLLRGAKGAM